MSSENARSDSVPLSLVAAAAASSSPPEHVSASSSVSPSSSSSSSLFFPQLERVEDVRRVIAELHEFKETHKDDLIIFNYKFGRVDSFPDPALAPDSATRFAWAVRRECRGVMFSSVDGRILARPYHKFFNVNELDETDDDAVNKFFSLPHVCMEKLDGAFIFPVRSCGTIRFCTKTGPTNAIAQNAQRFVAENTAIDYLSFSALWLDSGYTPVFEFLTTEKRLVVAYESTSLTLTGIRHIVSGRYLGFSDLLATAHEHHIPVVNEWKKGREARNVRELQQLVSQEQGIEGIVLRFEDGRMYKLKSRWYIETGTGHADVLCHENEIWRLILKEEMDDIRSTKMGNLRKRLEKFTALLMRNVEETADRLRDVVDELAQRADDDDEALARLIEQERPPIERPLLLELAHNTPSLGTTISNHDIDVVIRYILGFCGDDQQLERVRPLVGNVRFYE